MSKTNHVDSKDTRTLSDIELEAVAGGVGNIIKVVADVAYNAAWNLTYTWCPRPEE